MSESNHRATFGSALAYKEPMAAIEWLERAFGFETTLLITDEDGNLAHSEMSFGDSYIMVGNEWAENIKAPSSVGGAITQRVSVHLSSRVDDHCERARSAGALIVMEPDNQPYGARVYVCLDPEGHLWDFSEPLPFTPGEMERTGHRVQELRNEASISTFFPQAIYQDARAALEWLEKGFGFEPAMVIESPDNQVRAHLAFQDSQVAIGSESSNSPGPPRLSPRSVGGGNTQTIHVQLMDNIDAHCERAREAGAQIVVEPEDQFYGDRTYRALDPEGHMWTFGQTLRVTTPEEWEAATGLKTKISR